MLDASIPVLDPQEIETDYTILEQLLRFFVASTTISAEAPQLGPDFAAPRQARAISAMTRTRQLAENLEARKLTEEQELEASHRIPLHHFQEPDIEMFGS